MPTYNCSRSFSRSFLQRALILKLCAAKYNVVFVMNGFRYSPLKPHLPDVQTHIQRCLTDFQCVNRLNISITLFSIQSGEICLQAMISQAIKYCISEKNGGMAIQTWCLPLPQGDICMVHQVVVQKEHGNMIQFQSPSCRLK